MSEKSTRQILRRLRFELSERLGVKITQARFAQRLGVNCTTISLLETRDDAVINLEFAKNVDRVFGEWIHPVITREDASKANLGVPSDTKKELTVSQVVMNSGIGNNEKSVRRWVKKFAERGIKIPSDFVGSEEKLRGIWDFGKTKYAAIRAALLSTGYELHPYRDGYQSASYLRRRIEALEKTLNRHREDLKFATRP